MIAKKNDNAPFPQCAGFSLCKTARIRRFKICSKCHYAQVAIIILHKNKKVNLYIRENSP